MKKYENQMGFARLISSEIERKDIIEDNSIDFIVFEAEIHGQENGTVCVEQSNDLYHLLLRLTKCNNHTDLVGNIIPVDKISENTYKPTEKLYKFDENEFIQEGLGRITLQESVNSSIENHLIEYDLVQEKWVDNVEEDYTAFLYLFQKPIISSTFLFIVNIPISMMILRFTIPLEQFIQNIFLYVIPIALVLTVPTYIILRKILRNVLKLIDPPA